MNRGPDLESLVSSLVQTDLGWLGVVATARGVCLVRMGDDEREVETRLARELPFARIRRDDAALAPWCRALVDLVHGRPPGSEVPLDVRGSQLQQRVWKELARIPRGETRSYGEIARAVGLERGARAVARACATNPVPLAIPCHRVIEKSGACGGYIGGVERKRALLQRETEPPDA
jgi:AraC family transcriptional regulator of adaptative response/methylated-DNA-[protein]-cysteine methyltransferase